VFDGQRVQVKVTQAAPQTTTKALPTDEDIPEDVDPLFESSRMAPAIKK
jgi:hypothetical protein